MFLFNKKKGRVSDNFSKGKDWFPFFKRGGGNHERTMLPAAPKPWHENWDWLTKLQQRGQDTNKKKDVKYENIYEF